jgi:hypothetical protein
VKATFPPFLCVLLGPSSKLPWSRDNGEPSRSNPTNRRRTRTWSLGCNGSQSRLMNQPWRPRSHTRRGPLQLNHFTSHIARQLPCFEVKSDQLIFRASIEAVTQTQPQPSKKIASKASNPVNPYLLQKEVMDFTLVPYIARFRSCIMAMISLA